MNTRWSEISWFPACATIAIAQFAGNTLVPAQVEPESQRTEQEQSPVTQLLVSAAEALHIEATEPAADVAIRPTPLMTYSDPARDYSGAGVWRIGDTGRPLGIVAIEFWPRAVNGGDSLSHEILSFRDGPLAFTCAEGLDVRLSENAIEMREMPDAAAPRDAKPLRLIQMKKLASRFSVEETLEGEPYALRGLPRPIDRYEDPSGEILDGGIFVFVYGTNPELLVLIECDPETWRYGVARLSSAKLDVRIDEREVAGFPELRWPFPTRDYRAGSYNVTLPRETD